MDGHRDAFRTTVRRILRDNLGLSQRQAQDLAERADHLVDVAVTNMALFLVMSKTPHGIVAGVGIAAVAHKRVYRRVRYELDVSSLEEAESSIIQDASEIVCRKAEDIMRGMRRGRR
jgi:hypothetical protein